MQHNSLSEKNHYLWIYGFIAGFLATLTFHQGSLWLLRIAGLAPMAPFNMAPIPPWGIPAVISLAFWGGIWGILFAFLQTRFPRNVNYWLTSFLLGAILPSLVALLLVLPMKGKPLGGGWQWQLLLTVFLINGAWAVGTGFFLRSMFKLSERHPGQSACSPGMSC